MATLSLVLVWLTVKSLSFVNGNINDFRIGIQLCDSKAGQNTGYVRYTEWFRDSVDIWTVWAGDSNYYDPDGMQIGLFGRYNREYPLEFRIENIDIKFCIQLTDGTKNEHGNPQYNGYEQCTPWASAGGGWSGWAGDNNHYDFDAARVKIKTRNFPGLSITDIKVGIKLTDGGPNDNKAGYEEYSDWFVNSQSATWSGWAGDSNFYGPDYVKIYAGFTKSIANNAGLQDEIGDAKVQNEKNQTKSNNNVTVLVILSVIGVMCLIVCFALVIYGLRRFCKRSYQHIVVDDTDIENFDEGDIDSTSAVIINKH